MTDEKLIRRCIKLAEISKQKGDNAFGSLITKGDKVLVESGNSRYIDNDATNHAEILVMRQVQKLLGTDDLSECTIYSNCEPCPMCSFMIRELKIKKVVFGAYSPFMGGYSKWNILQDPHLEKLEPYFGGIPEVKGGILEKEAEKLFQERKEFLVELFPEHFK